MKIKHIVAIAIATAALTTLLILPVAAATEVTYVRPEPPVVIEKKVSDAREKWLAKLIQCESRGNPKAINPKDLDGTASYGLLQFKPSTFWAFGETYGIVKREKNKDEPKLVIMPDGSLGSEYDAMMSPFYQKAIVRKMMDDKSVNWHQQFPVCTDRYGLPPTK